MKKYLTCAALAFITAGIIGCSDSTSGNSAGIFIETNTGNKQTARIMVSTTNLGINAGDTLVIHKETADTVGDTAYVSVIDLQRIADSMECVSGIMVIDSFPVGQYDSVQIRPISGETRSASVSWNIAADTLNFDNALEASFDGVVPLTLPQGFEDLATANETFENMPVAVHLEGISKPCLQDFDGNVILLDRAKGSDTTLYWCVLPQVIFSNNGEIQLDIISNCQANSNLNLTLGRHVEHFDDVEISEAAKESELALTSVMGGARWTDSTDNWYPIENFKPLDDGLFTTVSFWLNMDSTMQAVPGSSYTRILSAKKDSVGFTVQQRGATGSINLRIDSHKNGVGDYNKTFGSAYNIMDGNWHNYAFTIRNDSVYVYVNGSLLEAGAFDAGENLTSELTPAIGGTPNIVGGIDELFFFDGTQSENWMRLFYALQAVNR